MAAALSFFGPAPAAFADDSDGESESGGESDSDGESGDGDHDSGGESGGGEGPSSEGEHEGSRGERPNGFRRGPLDQSDAARAVSLGQAISLKDALGRVGESYGGAVIDVTLRSTGRRLEYQFKVRTERGTVRTVRMDARTGRFLGLGALFR